MSIVDALRKLEDADSMIFCRKSASNTGTVLQRGR